MFNIQKSDYDFVRQAINDRAQMMINQLCPVVDMFADPNDLPDEMIPVVKINHLPQISVKKAVKVKEPEAPYGYKKDGTPRARPGRPTKSQASKRK